MIWMMFISIEEYNPNKKNLKHQLFFDKLIMKIPNIRELQQTAVNHSSDIDFKDFMNLFKNFTAKQYSFLVINATLTSDNPLRFRENPLERI